MKLVLFSFLLSSITFGATTIAECSKQYKKCKDDVANMFDKKPCKKKRAACEAEVASFEAQAVQNSTKNKMLNGTVEKEETSGLDNFGSGIQLSGKEAAEQRLREREAKQIGIGFGGGSLRDQMGNHNKPVDKKEEAKRRLQERERAKTNDSETIDNF
jgi:hypothetical protein